MSVNQYRDSSKLTTKQRLFIGAYLRNRNATMAAREAGYRGRDNTLAVQGHELLKHPLVKAQILELLHTAEHSAVDEINANGFIHQRAGLSGYVYLIREPFGRVKIGKTTDVERRISALNCGSPYELELLIAIPCDDMRKLENSFHERFAEKRVRREWFELSENDVSEVIKQYGEVADCKAEDVCTRVCDL